MATTELQERTEIERIENWRRERLQAAGYSPEAARQLAERHDIDLHDAIALLGHGCPADVALRILI